MLELTKGVAPSGGLLEFVRVFLFKATKVPDQSEEIADLVKLCLQSIVDPGAAEEKPPEAYFAVTVSLVDQSTRKVNSHASIKMGQFAEIVADKFRMSKGSDFVFYQVPAPPPRSQPSPIPLNVLIPPPPRRAGQVLLPDSAVLGVMMSKWQKMKEVTGKTTALLLKRKLLKSAEFLRPEDLVFSVLTFQQALWDFLQYPFVEDIRVMYESAARVMHTEIGSFQPFIEKGRLSDVGILDMVLPEVLCRQKERRQHHAQQIALTYQRIKHMLDPTEHRVVTMSRCLSLFQRLRLFGSSIWFAKQVTEIPPEKVSVPDAPTRMLKLCPNNPNAEFTISADIFGVRFLELKNSGTESGGIFIKGFFFTDDSPEKLVTWGARQNVIQFVVSVCEGSQIVPVTLNMITPAAVDIAYTVHMIHSMKGLGDKVSK